MKEIKLTRGLVTIVDDEDFEWLIQSKWCAYRGRCGYYAVRTEYGLRQRTLRMHRVILNAPSNVGVDHINGDSLDNRKSNLRFATAQQNQANRKHPNKNNQLGIKGVRKIGDKYGAYIKHNRKQINLGYFTLLEDADKAYRSAEIKYFGNFARQCGGTIDRGVVGG